MTDRPPDHIYDNDPANHGAPRRANGQAPPPHDLRAEAHLLGAALLRRDAAITVAELDLDAWYAPAHAHLAAAIRTALGPELDGDIDTTIVAHHLGAAGTLEALEIDGARGLHALVHVQAECPSPANHRRYADIIGRHAHNRRILGRAIELADTIRAGGDPAHLLNDLHEHTATAPGIEDDWPDIAAALAGQIDPPEPVWLRRSDGRALLYPAALHLLMGENSSGKSWLICLAAIEILRAGGAVIYVDFEDTLTRILARMLALGANPADLIERFAYTNPGALMLDPARRNRLQHNVDELTADLVIFDGWAEALARDGLDENSNADVARWLEHVARPITRAGAAVVIIDHVAKDKEKRSGARGAGHKVNALDGAAYTVTMTERFSREHRSGTITMTVEKDRNGAVGVKGDIAAVAHVTVATDALTIALDAHKAGEPIAKPFTPTECMAAVSSWLARNPNLLPLTKNQIAEQLPGRFGRKTVLAAIDRLVDHGFATKSDGPNRSQLIAHAELYRGEDLETEARPTPPTGPKLRLISDEELFNDPPD